MTTRISACPPRSPRRALIVVVLGSIFAGVATPTEAGALGSVGAMVLAVMNRSFSYTALRDAMETARAEAEERSSRAP